MEQTINFNTGRLYTAQGQLITATQHADGQITFYDHSRMIDGELTDPPATLTQRNVMAEYDAGNYKSTNRSRTDGLYVNGCNSVYTA